MEHTAKELIDFMEGITTYLHSWICTKDGEYKPVDKSKVRRAVLLLFAEGTKDVVGVFKKGVEDGTILIGVMPMGLSDNYKRERYEKALKRIEKLEKKYKFNYEENK